MLKAHAITAKTVLGLEAIYNRFCERAATDYFWAQAPVDFARFAQNVRHGLVSGYWLGGTTPEDSVGLMLYRLEDHRVLEINVIHAEVADIKTVVDRFMRRFMEDIPAIEGWDVVSYAMLGVQAAFIRTICWYGFRAEGQAILKFDMLDTLTLQILKQQKLAELSPEYRLAAFDPQYAGAVAEIMLEAFHEASDAYWDPRFRSLLGTRRIMGMLQSGGMGEFLAGSTTLAFYDEHPVGFCMLLQTGPMSGNIPLVGVRDAHKGKGLGNHMLRRTLEDAYTKALSGEQNVFNINTTADTDNFAAIKMYRRMGFREEHNYPHLYMSRQKALAFKPGVWC